MVDPSLNANFKETTNPLILHRANKYLKLA